MTQYLPANLLALFTARPPIPFKPPPDGLKKRKNAQTYHGVADFLRNFETTPAPLPTKGETREQRDDRKKQEKNDLADSKLQEKIATWDPHSDPNASGDPFKTLFLGRIKYETSENKLQREMEAYGPVRRIHLVYNSVSRKPRGYAFVEFEHERDMHSAYKHADGKKIDGRRIVVDVERGRTVKSWRPRRLGGGLGGTRLGGPEENIRHSGRVEQWEGKEKDRGEREERGERGDRERGDRDRDRERERDRGDRDRRDRGERGDKERKRSRSPRERRERGDRDRSDRRRDRDRGDREDRGRGDREERGRGDREERDRGERDGEREERERGEKGDRERGDRESRRDRNDASRERRRERDGGDEEENHEDKNNHYNNDQPWKVEDGEIKQEESDSNNYRERRDDEGYPPDNGTYDD